MSLLQLTTIPEALPPDAGTDTDKAFALRARYARIMHGADFPALSQSVVDAITNSGDEDALQRLANLVLREYGLTLRVLRLANSAQYRRGAAPTQSVTHAMMMLGAQVVRQMAAATVLFEHFRKRSPVLRELMLRSLLTAYHASVTAEHLGCDDPEAAYLAGMFRSLGEVLVAGYFQDDYDRIRSIIAEDGRTEEVALRMVLGFSYDEFGAEVASAWGLPETVHTMLRTAGGTPADTLAAAHGMAPTVQATHFAHALTSALYFPAKGAATGQVVEALLAAAPASMRLTAPVVGRVVSGALTEMRELLSHAGTAETRLRLSDLAQVARTTFGTRLELPLDDVTVVESPLDLTLRARLRQELQEMVVPQHGATIGAFLLHALEAVVRGGPFDRVLVCFFTADRQQLVARTGLGEGIDALLPRFVFPVSSRGGPVVALTQLRQPIYVPTDRVPLPQELRWAQQHGVSQFGVFPLVVHGKLLGAIYCDRTGPVTSPDRATVRYVKSVADLVVDAITARRSS
ncbi:HDOD domain-containing protein [Gemmatimonas phototrophica]|uniref:HDOD domain-containing protein n=1 Tax=Gemmatimonas phototrophica TaxID=1379270 RepID=A0A143BMG3_9BACT|nr:HDOD domain-containing protein [Gemmatimonas phototrophica]AMW06247.1 hypothetical protein GEMMAAP_18600 [Gemmatimonas phototrophica]